MFPAPSRTRGKNQKRQPPARPRVSAPCTLLPAGPAACTVTRAVVCPPDAGSRGDEGLALPPFPLEVTSPWPALSLGRPHYPLRVSGLKSLPNCPQLLSTRALSCPRPGETPSRREPGSQVRAGPTWGRAWLPCIGGWEGWARPDTLGATPGHPPGPSTEGGWGVGQGRRPTPLEEPGEPRPRGA